MATTAPPAGPETAPAPSADFWKELGSLVQKYVTKPVESAGKSLEGADNRVLSDIGSRSAPPAAAPAKKPKAKKKTAATTEETPSEAEIKSQIQAGDIWDTLGKQLVGEQSALDKPVEESISGALTAPAESSAATQALSSMGLAPNSSASKWLNNEVKQANANDAPMQTAMNNYEAAYAQGQSGVATALGGMGQANALEVDTAPEADWITTLAQHIMSNVNYYGEISPAQAASLTPAVIAALGQSGGGGAAAPGSIPITDTPSQIAQAVQSYYAKQPTAKLPGTQKAASGAAGGGTGGVIPSDIGVAPS